MSNSSATPRPREAPVADPVGVIFLPVLGPRRGWRIVAYVVFAAYGVAAVISFALDSKVYAVWQVVLAALLIGNIWLRWRRARVDHLGIRRQSTFRTTKWSEVAALIEPGRWDPSVHLRTTQGKDLPTGVPAGYLDQLATLSGKPVEARRSPTAKANGKTSTDR